MICQMRLAPLSEVLEQNNPLVLSFPNVLSKKRSIRSLTHWWRRRGKAALSLFALQLCGYVGWYLRWRSRGELCLYCRATRNPVFDRRLVRFMILLSMVFSNSATAWLRRLRWGLSLFVSLSRFSLSFFMLCYLVYLKFIFSFEKSFFFSSS